MVFLVLFIYVLNLIVILKRRLYRSAFIMHFFFTSIIFIGPTIYYELGFTTYAHSFEPHDLLLFEWYAVFVFLSTLFYWLLIDSKIKIPFNRFFARHSNRNLNLTAIYFLFWYAVVLLYIAFYARELPIFKFLFTGTLPDRLDQSDAVQFFYTFSSFFMVFIPSGYFFFIRFLKGNIKKFLLLLLVVFILTSGGHKGLVAFFIIFALFFSGYKFNFKYIMVAFIALIGLLGIYTVTKGKTLNKETLLYLMESPPRRFFVTQGSAFITRISMDRRDLYLGDVHEYQLIKRETFQAIYPNTNDRGAAPTMFIGDMHVRYGMVLTCMGYLAFLIFTFPFIKGVDAMPDRKLHIWWSLFIYFFLLGVAEISYTSSLRMFLALFNLIFLITVPYLKIANANK